MGEFEAPEEERRRDAAPSQTVLAATVAPDTRMSQRRSSSATRVQRKLTVGAASDPLEHEADATADRVVRLLRSRPSGDPADERNARVRRSGEGDRTVAPDETTDRRIRSSHGRGAPTPDRPMRQLAPALGAAGVRVRRSPTDTIRRADPDPAALAAAHQTTGGFQHDGVDASDPTANDLVAKAFPQRRGKADNRRGKEIFQVTKGDTVWVLNSEPVPGAVKPRRQGQPSQYVEVFKVSSQQRGWMLKRKAEAWALSRAPHQNVKVAEPLLGHWLTADGKNVDTSSVTMTLPAGDVTVMTTSPKLSSAGESFVEVQVGMKTAWVREHTIERAKRRVAADTAVAQASLSGDFAAGLTKGKDKERFQGATSLGELRTKNLLDVAAFQKATETRGHQRGDALKAIDKRLAVLAPLLRPNSGSAAPADDALKQLYPIQYAVENWILDHAIAQDANTTVMDPKRKARFVAMSAMLTQVQDRIDGLLSMKTTQGATDQALASEIDTIWQSVDADEQHQKIKQKYEGAPTSCLTKLGYLIDMAVPSAGDSSEIEVDFRWPVEPTGIAFVGGKIIVSAANDSPVGAMSGDQADDNIVARMDIRFTVGAQWAEIGKVQAELGGYLETSAKTGRECMTLMSYALYRRFRESYIVPDGAISYLWGGGRTGDFAKLKSEAWAAGVEKHILSEEGAYAETGLLAAVSGGGGIKNENFGAEFSGGVTFSRGTKYDAESVTSVKGELGARNQERGGRTKAQQRLGRRTQSLGFDFGVDVGPFSGAASFAVHWQTPDGLDAPGTQKLEVDGLELEASFSGSVPASGPDELAERVAAGVMEGIKLISQKTRAGVRAHQDQANDKLSAETKKSNHKVRSFGELWTTIFDGVDQLAYLDGADSVLNPAGPSTDNWLGGGPGGMGDHLGNMGESLGLPTGTDLGGPATAQHFQNAWGNREIESSIGLTLTFGFGWEPEGGRMKLAGAQISISIDKSRSLTIPMFLDVSQSKSSRIVAFTWEAGEGWGVE